MSLRTMVGIALLTLTLTGCAQPVTGGPVRVAAAPAASNGTGADGAGFCAVMASAQEQLNPGGGVPADLDVDPAAIGDAWERAAAVAPAELAPDLQTLA